MRDNKGDDKSTPNCLSDNLRTDARIDSDALMAMAGFFHKMQPKLLADAQRALDKKEVSDELIDEVACSQQFFNDDPVVTELLADLYALRQDSGVAIDNLYTAAASHCIDSDAHKDRYFTIKLKQVTRTVAKRHYNEALSMLRLLQLKFRAKIWQHQKTQFQEQVYDRMIEVRGLRDKYKKTGVIRKHDAFFCSPATGKIKRSSNGRFCSPAGSKKKRGRNASPFY